MKCECLTGLTQASPDALSDNHHKLCPKYKTEKHPRLLYYEEAEDCWVQVPECVENIISTDNLDDGESQEIMFKRVDMTDFEVDSAPEI